MGPDFDDTVSRPPRHAVVERASDIQDVEDTIIWTRPATSPIDVIHADVPITHADPAVSAAPEAPVAPVAPDAREPESPEPESSEPENSVPEATTIQTPPALVEPPPPGTAPRLPPPIPGSAVPDVSDNIWSEPIPDKPLPFRIRLDDGTLVALDQPVYLGRRPSVPRIHPGGVPLLVTFDSPQREVSSTHLELTTVGGAIVATDLKSTNGSIVRIPGAAPHTLLGGESAVLTPGTVIELGDGNSIELLPPDFEGAD